jgi:Predicted Zn-dependent protease (DUF2268)
MLINLLPDFLSVLDSTDRTTAYHRYLAAHRRLLEPYWQNYVIEPEGPHFEDIVRQTAHAGRADLRAMLEHTDLVSLARRVEQECVQLLETDTASDVVLMVGVGAANAGELVINGRGIAFVCLEHFTGVSNPETQGLGLDPELLPLGLSHELAHVVRYTSPTSRSEMRDLIAEDGGNYSFWNTGRRATLRELLVNEGIAVHVSRAISPSHAAWEYYGYERKQYARLRELESIVSRAVVPQLDQAGLGLRLKYLVGGTSDDARSADRYVLPERCGYYVGAKMCEAAVATRGLAWAVRASAAELVVSETAAASA